MEGNIHVVEHELLIFNFQCINKFFCESHKKGGYIPALESIGSYRFCWDCHSLLSSRNRVLDCEEEFQKLKVKGVVLYIRPKEHTKHDLHINWEKNNNNNKRQVIITACYYYYYYYYYILLLLLLYTVSLTRIRSFREHLTSCCIGLSQGDTARSEMETCRFKKRESKHTLP